MVGSSVTKPTQDSCKDSLLPDRMPKYLDEVVFFFFNLEENLNNKD